MIEFKLLKNEFIQLCDLLKTTGLCQTGGHAKTVIAGGEVKVDNKIELRKRCKIKASQVISYNGETIKVS